MMKDSTIDPNWIREQMRANPPSVRPNGNVFTGPVRLSFVNLFKPGKPGTDGGEGKFGAALLFPPGTDMKLFADTWTREARAAFPNNWDPNGNPIGLHSPFHDQAEKAYAAKPLAGYTPGAIFFNVSSKFKPVVVDASQNLVVEESKAYPGVWAFCALNVYSYKNKKIGIGFGLQTVMLIADDSKLAGGGGNPQADFGNVQISAQTNMAAKFDALPQPAQGGTPAGIMPSGGYQGQQGNLPVQGLPNDDLAGLM